MFSSSHLKSLHPLQVKSPPSTAISSMKLKNLIHTLIVSHMCRIIRALSKLKAVIIEILKNNQSNNQLPCQKKHYRKTKKIVMGSFRLHYNWCSSKSSHIMPLPARVFQELPVAAGANHLYYDSKQQAAVEDCPDSQLAGYLQWLEENIHDDKGTNTYSSTSATSESEINEIDVLAEMFISNCHEKFILEKQESDRRFQEMLARGL